MAVVVCYFCGCFKKDIPELADHMRCKHTQERPVKCPQCSMTLVSNRRLSFHKQIHHPTSDRVKCLQCHKSFTTKAYLRHHVLNVHGKGTYECDRCDFKTPTAYRLRNHSRIHEKNRVRKFICEICKKGFFTRAELRQHCRIHSNTKNRTQVGCYFCGCVINMDHLAAHMRCKHTQERPVKCPQCPMTFGSSSVLHGHIIRRHSTSERLKCLQCIKSFQTKGCLRQHVINVHGVPKYECDKCNFKTVSSLRLGLHSRIHEKNRVRKFVCEICKKGFLTRGDYNRHFRIHSNSKSRKQVACYFCGSLKHNMSVLADHIRCKHTQERPVKCPQCPMTFASSSTLYHHVPIHSTSGKVKCPQCPKSYQTKDSLRQHFKNLHGVQNYECEQCNYKTTTKLRLRIHSGIHEKNRVRKFVCDICKKGFLAPQHLCTHLAIHKDDRKVGCYFCPNIYMSKVALYNHLLFHTKEKLVGVAGKKCSQCSVVCDNYKELQKHVRGVHGVLRPHKCDICGWKDEKQSRLERHMATKHSSLRPFQCSTCPATFNLLNTLKGHISRVHFGLREFICKKCPKMFGSAVALKNHGQSMHSVTKPFPCTICGAPFASKLILSYHRKSKHEPKGYHCYFCTREFILFYNYRDHLFTHTKERPFKCVLNVEGKQCKFTSFKKHLLKDHIRVVHEGYRLQCSLCSYKASARNALFAHITRIHTRERHVKCSKCTRQFCNSFEMRIHKCRADQLLN